MDWIAAVEREGNALATAARRDPAAPVPACPGWDAAQVARHCGEAHRWATDALRSGTTEMPAHEAAPPDAGVAWFEEGLAALLDAMRSSDPSAPAWTFDPGNRTASFWHRRQAHETAVHRVDAEQAVGLPVTVDPELAVDGVDELLTAFAPRIARRGGCEAGGTIHLHATDVEGEWLVTFGDGEVAVERGHAKGDAAVRGPAAGLYLWLWGRAPLDGLEVFGDASLAAKLRRVTTA